MGLGTRRERLRVLEAHSAESAGLLTERTRERLRRAKRRSSPHVEAEQPAPTGLSSAQTLPPEIERRDTGPKMRLVPHVQRSCCTDSGKPPETTRNTYPRLPPCRDWPDCLAMELDGFDAESTRKILCENARELNELQPA